MTRTKLVLCILLAAMTTKTMAKIDLWVATATDINAAYDSIKSQVPSECDPVCGSWEDPTDQTILCINDPSGICSNWGANQYRYNGFLAVKNGHIPAYRSCIADINDDPSGTKPFLENLIIPTESYIVYGLADNFTVPEDGNYSFWVRQHLQLFIFIDGKLVNNAKNGNEQILANYDGEVLGTVDLEDEFLANSSTAYQTHGVNLTAGTHTFEIYYSASSEGTEQQASISWQTPTMRAEDPLSWQIIPAQTYGPAPCPDPPEAEIVSIAMDDEILQTNESVCLADNVEFTISGQLLKKPEWAEDIVYEWDMGDGNILETETSSVSYTYSDASFTAFPNTPKLTIHYNNRYQTRSASSDVSITVVAEPCKNGQTGTIRSARSFTNGRPVAQFRNNLILNNSRDTDMKVAVYSLSGKLLAQTNVLPGVTAEMKMSNLSKGLYLVKAFTGSELIDTQSFVRQ